MDYLVREQREKFTDQKSMIIDDSNGSDGMTSRNRSRVGESQQQDIHG